MTSIASRGVLACFSLSAFLAVSGAAQTTHPVGWRDVPLPNATASGSPILQSRIYYPATQAGQNTPLLARSGGWPVLVFLHGLGALGRNYPDLANYVASRGYVAVMSDTAQSDNALQRLDGIALHPSLVAENARTTSFLFGALDMNHAAVSGHSLGGGNTVRVLASNPGYVAGVCFAPLAARTEAALVRVPLLILHGEGDTVLPWRTSALVNFDAATAFTGLKALYLLDSAATHGNVVIPGTSQTGREIFGRCAAAATGWLDRFLDGRAQGLEEVIGPRGRADLHLTELRLEVEAPEHWQWGSGRLATTQGMRITAEPGWTGLFVAARSASLPTPFGTLLLDPATLVYLPVPAVGASRLLDVGLPIPNDPAYVGAVLPFQALALGRGLALRLTGASELRIVP
jgi:dienelactone hydrolase